MDRYNAAAWLLDRHLEAGNGGRTAYRVDGATTTYAGLQAEVWRAPSAPPPLRLGRPQRGAPGLDDQPGRSEKHTT